MKIKSLLIVSTITTAILIVIMALQGRPLKTTVTPNGILSLEFAGTVRKANEIYNNWKENLFSIANTNILIDFLFLISYGCFLYACTRLLAARYTSGWKKTGLILSRMVIVAAVFDAVENLLMLRTLGGSIYKEIVASTFMFASAKFLIVAFAIVYILISLVGLLFKRKSSITDLSLDRGY